MELAAQASKGPDEIISTRCSAELVFAPLGECRAVVGMILAQLVVTLMHTLVKFAPKTSPKQKGSKLLIY